MKLEGIEVTVTMQQISNRFNAIGGDKTINRFANGNATPAQGAVVLSASDGQFWTKQADLRKLAKCLSGLFKILVVSRLCVGTDRNAHQ